MYTNTMKLLLVFILPFIGLAENVNNDMTLDSLVNCINKAIEPNQEQYIDMLYLALFSDYIISPCNEIKAIWDELDITSNMAPSSDSNGININDTISELVQEHSELFDLIFTWFNNDLFSYIDDSDHIIRLSLSILSWLNHKKSHYHFVDDWCDISWTRHGINEYNNIATKCLLIDTQSLDDIIDPNHPLIRRLGGNRNNLTLSERLANAKQKCLNMVQKGIALAIQTTFEATISFPELYYIGTSVKLGLGTYFTLGGKVEAATYLTVQFIGVGWYYPIQNKNPIRPGEGTWNVALDTTTIIFRGHYSGSDYMGWNFAVAGGLYLNNIQVPFGLGTISSLGANAFAIFNWETVLVRDFKFSNFAKAYMGRAFGLGKTFKGSLIRLEVEPFIYNKKFIKIIQLNLFAICDLIPQINETNSTINPDVNRTINASMPINLFYKRADWWSTEKEIQYEWTITYSFTDNNTINQMSNYPQNWDNIIWIGENNEGSLDWESYSVTVKVEYNKYTGSKEEEPLTGFIFGATDINNAYFFGISQAKYKLGYYNGDENLTVIAWGANSPATKNIAKTITQTIKATLYVNGSVSLEVDGSPKCKDTHCEESLFTSDDFVSTKGCVGLRTQKDASQSTYYEVTVDFV